MEILFTRWHLWSLLITIVVFILTGGCTAKDLFLMFFINTTVMATYEWIVFKTNEHKKTQ